MVPPEISLEEALEKLKSCFFQLPDPRIERCREHPLENVLLIAICAVLCGTNYWTEVELFGKAKRSFFERFLDLEHGIPSHDTFGRVFSALDSALFGQCFTDWVKSCFAIPPGSSLNFDGKTICGSHDRVNGKKKGAHIVSAWVNELGICFAQQKVDEKSNEITAIPEVLNMLEIENCVVTIDAMGCQTAIASLIRDKKADYILAVGGNQPSLEEEVRLIFDVKAPEEQAQTLEKDHGRIDTRTISVIRDLEWVEGKERWKDMSCVIRVESKREFQNKTESHERFFISSMKGTAKELLKRIRGHWAIENNLHWCLDVGFREDESRVRVGNATENFAILRKWALNLLKQDKKLKVGIESKRKNAGWNEEYLAHLLLKLL